MADAAGKEEKTKKKKKKKGEKRKTGTGRLEEGERERECSVVRPMDRRKKEFLVWTSPTGRAGGS